MKSEIRLGVHLRILIRPHIHGEPRSSGVTLDIDMYTWRMVLCGLFQNSK